MFLSYLLQKEADSDKVWCIFSWLNLPQRDVIAINRTWTKKQKFVAPNNSIIHDITSTAWCKSQQNALTTEINIKTSN